MSGTHDSPRLNISPTEFTYANLQRIYSMDGQLVNHLPDTVEVIRCKDCKYWDENGCQAFGKWFGEKEMVSDDYCSRAERREG